ncbi:hypothetical protein Tco_0344345 [Tanacetum coccineum]
MCCAGGIKAALEYSGKNLLPQSFGVCDGLGGLTGVIREEGPNYALMDFSSSSLTQRLSCENMIPPDHDHDVPVVEPNQHDEYLESSLLLFFERMVIRLLPSFHGRDIDSPFFANGQVFEMIMWLQMAHALVWKQEEKARIGFYGKLILDLGEQTHSFVMQDMNESREISMGLGHAQEFYQETIRRRFVFKDKGPNEAIDVPLKMEKSDCVMLREYHVMNAYRLFYVVNMLESCLQSLCTMTQASIRRMIKESVDAAIGCWSRGKGNANVRNDASGLGQLGVETLHLVFVSDFWGLWKVNLMPFHGVEGAVEWKRTTLPGSIKLWDED